MARINGDGPAFPRPTSIDTTSGTLPDGDRVIDAQAGMTYRQWLAGHALAGYLAAYASNGDDDLPEPEHAAREAVQYADALIAALGESPDTK